MATRLQLQERVYSRLGLPTDDGHVTATAVQEALRAALQEYATEADWPWLLSEETITTVSGTRTYALPTGYVRTVYLIDASGTAELEYRPRRQLSSYEEDQDRPRFYTGLVGTIALYPKPNGVYTLTHGFVRSEPELTTDGSTPLIPDAFSDFIVVLAARKIAVRRKDAEHKQLLDVEYAQWLQRLLNEQRRTAFLGGVKAVFRGV